MIEPLTSLLFEGLPAEELSPLLESLEHRQLAAGTPLLIEGDRSSEMYLVQSGAAEVSIANPTRGEYPLARVGPGGILGEMALLTGHPASATVRAASDGDLEVLVFQKADFIRLARLYPQIYHNLMAIHSERLVRTEQTFLHDYRDRVTFLVNEGAPPLLGYALACSLAWHMATSILLLILTDPSLLSEELQALGPLPPALPSSVVRSRSSALLSVQMSTQARAHLMVAAPTGAFAPTSLAETLQALCSRYERVLIQTPGGLLPAILGARRVRLTNLHAALPESSKDRPTPTIRAWANRGWLAHPDQAGELRIPALTPVDRHVLRNGLLPPATLASKALGWAARDLAGLKVGLALGSGATKGYAHLGVLRVFERIGLPIDYIAGTSIGASIAAMYADGYSVDAMRETLDQIGNTAFRLTLPNASLLSSAGLRAAIQRLAGNRRIEGLMVPLALVAADITTQREVVFRRGLIWSALLASMAIPGIYPPQRIGPYTLVDGGVVNPVPSNVVAEMGADQVIAVNLFNQGSPLVTEPEAGEAASGGPSLFQTMLRSLELMQSNIATSMASAATILIEPIFLDPVLVGLRNFTDGGRFIEQGEAAAEAAFPLLASTFPWLNRKKPSGPME